MSIMFCASGWSFGALTLWVFISGKPMSTDLKQGFRRHCISNMQKYVVSDYITIFYMILVH